MEISTNQPCILADLNNKILILLYIFYKNPTLKNQLYT